MEFDLPHLHEAIAAAVPDRDCVVWRGRRWTCLEVADDTVLGDTAGDRADVGDVGDVARALLGSLPQVR